MAQLAADGAESDIVLPIQLPAGVPSNTRNAITMSVSAIGTQRIPCVLAQVGETRSRNVARLRARSKSIWSPTLAKSWTGGSGSQGREAAIPCLGLTLILMALAVD